MHLRKHACQSFPFPFILWSKMNNTPLSAYLGWNPYFILRLERPGTKLLLKISTPPHKKVTRPHLVSKDKHTLATRGNDFLKQQTIGLTMARELMLIYRCGCNWIPGAKGILELTSWNAHVMHLNTLLWARHIVPWQILWSDCGSDYFR